MEIYGLKTNASLNQHNLSFSFLLRNAISAEKVLMDSTMYFKPPEYGYLDIEMKAALSNAAFNFSFHIITLSSSRISSLKDQMLVYIGRVENLTFHDSDPYDTHESVLRRKLTTHFA